MSGARARHATHTTVAGALLFPPRLRIRRKTEFDSLYRHGRRLNEGFFTMTWRRNELGVPRLGLAVAARAAGNAVARNRLRRLVRESFRLAQTRLPAVDLVIGVRSGVSAAPRELLRAQLDTLWTRLAQACG